MKPIELSATLKTPRILVAAEVTRLKQFGSPSRHEEEVRASSRRLLHFKRALTGVFFVSNILAAVGVEVAPIEKNPQAVQEVIAGKRSEANAAWWGFNEDDATDALQAAIRSGAKRVIVPNVGMEWIVRPIQLAGEQELVLEKGVVITAKRGEYRGGGDSVLNADNLTNLVIRGYGATVRMQKEDYIVGKVLKDLGWNRWYGQYEKAEWRMALGIRGCTNVKVEGLTLRDSGGDGIYIQGGGKLSYSKDIHLKGVICDNNYRQGISIISVDGLLVEDSSFNNTWGTPPSSGVDIEPDTATERIKNVVFRNCRFNDNYGDGIEVFLANLRTNSENVSILFDHCNVTSRRGPGIRVTRVGDDGPDGLIEFRNCVVEGTEGYGLKVRDKSADHARVRFVECVVRDAARDRQFADMWTPVALEASQSDRQKKLGGVDFVDCVIEDTRDRPALIARSELGLFDVTGNITIRNPHGLKTEFCAKQEGVTLQVKEASASPFRNVKVYAEPGRFGGWPANHGVWSWGNEILAGFSRGYYKDLGLCGLMHYNAVPVAASPTLVGGRLVVLLDMGKLLQREAIGLQSSAASASQSANGAPNGNALAAKVKG